MRQFLTAVLLAIGLTSLQVHTPLLAQVFDGPGLEGGIDAASAIDGPIQGGDVRQTILNILAFILNYVALAATVVIVIAGIILIVGGGTDESKDRAKKLILYTVYGLLVILFARIIVHFFIRLLPDAIL